MKLFLLAFVITTSLVGAMHAQVMNEVQGDAAAPSISTGNYNTVYGDSSGYRLTTGDGHIMIGAGAGMFITTSGNSSLWHYNPSLTSTFPPSSGNVVIGQGAGFQCTTGLDNIFIGSHAGWSVTNGSNNTFIGAHSGWNTTTGSQNTFLGDASGIKTTTGNNNVFLGQQAGRSNTTGSYNTFTGKDAGASNTTGYQNVFYGRYAGYDNTTGHFNTYVGDSSGIDASIVVGNTFVGHAAGSATEYANYNTFVGHNAGWDNNRLNNTDDANGNTYVGSDCGYTNRVGEYNIMMGYQADFQQAGSRTTGGAKTQNNFNIAIGYRALLAQTKNHGIMVGNNTYISQDFAMAIGDSARAAGMNGIAIGRQAQVTASNAIAFGYGTTVGAANEIHVGNAATTFIGGPVNWTATSDQRLKTAVREDVIGLDFINRLRPVTYQFDPAALVNVPEGLVGAVQARGEIRYTGFLAQEVEVAAQETGFDFSGVASPRAGEDSYGLRYAEFTVPLVKAVQELSQQVESLEKELAQRDVQLGTLSAEVTEMKKLISEMRAEQIAEEKLSGADLLYTTDNTER